MARIRSQLQLSLLREHLLGDLKQRRLQKTVTDQTRLKIETVRDYLSQHFSEKHTRAELAAVVEMSPDHLGRMFKQQTGEKISEFLNRVRMEKASELTPGNKVKTILSHSCI